MSDLRQTVCKIISSLPVDCSEADVSQELDPLFASISETSLLSQTEISPILMASDKGNSTCIEYLLRKRTNEHQSVSEFIGNPLDKSPDTGNTAVHHAAMSGCEEAILILANFDESLSVDDFASVRNSHGDTPLMMAAANGHLQFIMKIIEHSDPDEIERICLAKNDANDSCLSLASCHGWPLVVEYLLAFLPIETELHQTCKMRYEQMEAALNNNPALLKQKKNRLDSVGECIEMLEKRLSRLAEETASMLLAEEDSTRSKMRKQTRKKKQTRKGKEASGRSETAGAILSSSNLKSGKEVDSEAVKLIALADGTVAVMVKGQEPDKPNLRLPNTSSVNVDELFRKRFELISDDIDSVMKALCLDVSMLLYTSHGMALNLSPSQLDVVQGILEKQLVAVQEARSIQDRMHSPPKMLERT